MRIASLMIEAVPLSSQVHRRLLEEILSGRRPSGSVLRETELASELNVSRTPIREALRRLRADGLVELQANRSAIVRSLTAEQIVHVYQVREALEGMAAELACPRLRAADFARLDKLAEAAGRARSPLDVAPFHRFDAELHRLIAERSGNPVLAREITRFHDLVQLVRDRVGNLDDCLLAAYDEHLAIIEALRSGNALAARQAMIEHIRHSCETGRMCVQQPEAVSHD
jgi:DNA-binding GntR family transcriptional regulator